MLLVFSILVICFFIYNLINFNEIRGNFNLQELYFHKNGCDITGPVEKNLSLFIYLIHRHLMIDMMLIPLVIVHFKSSDDIIAGVNKLDELVKLSCF